MMRDPLAKYDWQNVLVKQGLMEDKDYQLVDKNVWDFWKKNYGLKDTNTTIKRKGIEINEEEAIIEVYLKKIQFMPVPNRLFGFKKPQ